MFYNNLKKLLEELDISQRQFALKIGTDPGYISKLINGKIIPNERMLLLIENVFNVNREWLLYGQGEMFKSKTSVTTKSKILDIIDTLDDNQISSVVAFLKYLQQK